MARPGNPQKDPISALYFQVYCEVCGAALYSDEVKHSGARVLCGRCLAEEDAKLLIRHRRLLERSAPVPFVGMSVFQFLMVAVILGVIVAAVVPTLWRIKERAERNALEIKFLTNQDPTMQYLATDLLLTQDKADLAPAIQRLAETAGIGPEDMPKFRAELLKYKEYDTPEAQAGWVLQVMERWKARVEPALDVVPQATVPPER